MKKMFALIILTALASVTVLADIASPELPKETVVEGRMIIQIKDDVTEPTVIISRELLNQIAGENTGMGKETAGFTPSGIQTLVSGLFLSLALILGGVWFSRSKKFTAPSKVVLGLAVFAISGFTASIVLANAAPPRFIQISPRIFSKEMLNERGASGPVKIEISEEGNDNFIVLVVPKDKK